MSIHSKAATAGCTSTEDANSHRQIMISPSQPLNDATRDQSAGSDDDIVKDNSPKSLVARLICIFPKVEPLPWPTFTALSVWCAIPPACFILFFTQMGFGEQIYFAIANEMGGHAYGLALGLTASIFALYMLDADEWTSKCGRIFLHMSIFVIVCGFALLALLTADRFPYGTICMFVILYPVWLLALKLIFYDEKDTRVFVSWLSGPLLFTSVMIGVLWITWVFSDPDNEWNIVARMVAAERTGCEPNYETYPECRKEAGSEESCFYVEKSGHNGEEIVFPEGCDQSCTNVYNNCLNGVILWVGPVLVSLTTLFLSFFCTFLRTGELEKEVVRFGAVWMFLLFAMWVAMSLAGVAEGVSGALAALTLASLVASAVFMTVSFSKEERSKNAATVMERLREKYGKHLDVARGLFVVTCLPIVLVYFLLSMTNQFIRRTGILPCSQPPGDKGDIFTTRTRKQIQAMRSWDRSKVYTYAVYWGVLFMTLQVLVVNLTVVFLSWMIDKTADYGLAAVTAIMVGVGVMMFLLPPVPGVPVYMTLGIVLPAQGHGSLGWIGSIAYSTAIGLMLKLFSSALQQKMIGENLSHYVKVRQFVGINSALMKTMRLVLGQSGLSVPKVSILIGGPDWPTSVLCGIMRLSLLQIMLGTLPVVFLIFPTCLTGALLYMSSLVMDTGNPTFPWAGTVSTLTVSLTAIVQLGSMIVAAYYLEQTSDKRADEVEAMGDDKEVKQADDKAAHLNRCYQDVTQWHVLPLAPKLLIKVAVASITAACYLVQLFPNLCFTPHSLTDSIDENLEGNVLNIFLPLGWVAVGLFCISMILIYMFASWGKRKAGKIATGIAPERMAVSDSNKKPHHESLTFT